MQAFIDFLVNNYFWFLVISLILVFALIGYLVDTNEKKESVNLENDEKEIGSVNLEQSWESSNLDELNK